MLRGQFLYLDMAQVRNKMLVKNNPIALIGTYTNCRLMNIL